MKSIKNFVLLGLIMVLVALCVGGYTIITVHNFHTEEERKRLVEIVQSRARLIEEVARFDLKYSRDFPHGSEEATISQIRNAHDKFKGFGETGEFTLARLVDDQISFILRHRHSNVDIPPSVSFHDEIAEPMRRALSGKSGSMVGLDYRGVEVLAAFEPVAILDMGVVAKIDLDEIRAPFIKTSYYALLIAVLIICIATIVFFRINRSIVQQLLETEAIRKIEKALRSEQDLTRNSIDSLNDTFFLFDPSTGKALRWNGAFREVSGYSDDEISALKAPDSYYSQDDLTKAASTTEEVATRGFAKIEISLICKNGKTIPFEYSITIMKSSDNNLIISIGRDITERIRAEKALMLAKEDAESANKAKSEFLAVMSHEIRTPLNAILGMTEVAKEYNQDPELSRFLKVIDRSGNNLLALIEDILDLSQIESGRLKLEHKLIHIQELTQEALDIHITNAESKLLDLTCRIEPEIPNQFNGDQKRIRQVLLNLLGNAVKFTEQGKLALLVSCPSPQIIQFSVLDSGIGIPEEKQKLIFEPFSQVDTSNTRQQGGIGLGLAICKRLVNAMNGKIWVESEVGKGSAFHFSIPLSVEGQNLALLSSAKRPQGESMQKSECSILLAEDFEDNAMVIEAYLNNTSHHVEIVKDGSQAVEKIQSGKKYDLILMDIQMPGMDGLEATRKIRAWENEQGDCRTPILALTSHAMNGDEEKSSAAGCDSHITKPIAKKKLLEMIDQFVK
jgi:PAS domain S-box-containing protein